MQEIEAAKENFLRSVQSTLTEPIGHTIQTVDQLLATKLDAHQTQLVNTLNETLSSVHKNSQNLACLADIQTRSFQIELRPVSPIFTFEKIVESFRAKAEAAGIHLIVYIDPNAPREIYTDEKYLTKVMENLIENAIKYTGRGGSVYVDVKTKHLTDIKVSLDVAVTDTGIGIDKTKLKTYLQPFANSGTGNLGVGLSTSFHILKAMHTQLKIASEINKGSRFSFSLEVNSSSDALYPTHPDIKIGILIDDRSVFAYAKLLYQYIISMGLAVVSIKDMNDPNIAECHGLFLVTDICEADRIRSLSKQFPQTSIIPTVLASKKDSFLDLKCAERFLFLPVVPSMINDALAYIEKRLPKEITEANKKDHQTIQHIAKQAKREKVKILVVEDNPINLKLVKVILSRYDFEVDSAENGQIGVDRCKEKRYDMVLMDIDMPVMDGITATQTIKAYENEEGLPETPIVALTSHDLAGERAEIIESGLDEHMPKPLNVGRLELMLENYIGYKPERSK